VDGVRDALLRASVAIDLTSQASAVDALVTTLELS